MSRYAFSPPCDLSLSLSLSLSLALGVTIYRCFSLAQVFVGASGSTLTAREKHEKIVTKVNDLGKKEGWDVVDGAKIETKIDSLKRKGKKVYKTFRTKTRTGAPVGEDDFNLEVSTLIRILKLHVHKTHNCTQCKIFSLNA